MINAHTHLYSALMPLMSPRASARGLEARAALESATLAPPLRPGPSLSLGVTFRETLEQIWWPLDRALDADMLRAGARLYVAEAVLAGTTAIIDHHESPSMIEGSLDILADVCEELGMPALLCYGATERNGGREEAKRGLAECVRFITKNRRKHVRGAIGLHAAFTVSDATIAEAGALCRELGVPLHVHVAEDRIDIDGFARLRNALVPGSIVAHGVHLTEDEVRECDAMGLWLVHNPRSNAANRVGYAASLRASQRVVLGTDGFPSDMLQEIAALDEMPDVIAARVEMGRLLEATVRAIPLEKIRAEAAIQAQRLTEKLRGEPCNAFR
jgi:cytosine/adenosine deaminase-related metal-dependent hydrolase